jgi:hypothetical protein
MTYLRVLDEGVQVQDYCIQMDFVGAGVTVTRPFTNDSIVVTIPGAAAVTGWTDDGAIVRLTTIADNVSIGSLDIIAGEKLRVVNVAGVAIRVEGQEWFVNTGVADAAASQAASYVERFTASMWDAAGVAAVARDFDLYAGPSTLADDETTARAQLAIDYEGFRLLEIRPAVAAPVDARGVILNSLQAAGLGAGASAFTIRTTGLYVVTDTVLQIETNNGGTILATFRGDGSMILANLIATTAVNIGGNQVVGAQGAVVADAAGGAVIDAEARTAINTLLARLRVHGLIDT